MIASGSKTLEIRSRPTKHRGELLICQSRGGGAVAIVEVVDCRLFTADDDAASGGVWSRLPETHTRWAWELRLVRRVTSDVIKGRLGFFDVDMERVRPDVGGHKALARVIMCRGEAPPAAAHKATGMAVEPSSGPGPLVEWIAQVSQGEHRAPWHLLDWCELIEQVLLGGVRACCAVPIRGYKTWTTIYGIAWLLVQRPTLRIIVLCADHERALELGKMIRRTCEMVGIGPTRGENTIVDWKNDSGGGVCTMSAAQSKLGRDVDVLFCDDPLTEHTCDDAHIRDAIDHSIAHYTARCVRKGVRGSVLIVMSRWHPDDPIGRRLLRRAETWKYIHAQALLDTGEAWAPEVWPLDTLLATRRELAEVDPSERLWFAQFQNQPFVPGRDVFGEPARYVQLPAWHGFRDGIGIDMSYSAGAQADYFALVAGRVYGGALFLRSSVRMHADLNLIEHEVRAAYDALGTCPVYSYVSGPELGAIQWLTGRGIRCVPLPARYNKLVRSQRTRVDWNAGKIQVPADGVEWPAFMRRVQLFRGAESDQDDEVDALVSLHDGMMGVSGPGSAPVTLGKPRI